MNKCLALFSHVLKEFRLQCEAQIVVKKRMYENMWHWNITVGLELEEGHVMTLHTFQLFKCDANVILSS